MEKLKPAADTGLSQFVSREVPKLGRPKRMSMHLVVPASVRDDEDYAKVLDAR